MNELQKKWIAEGYAAIETIENALKAFESAKKKVVENKDYEEAAKIRDAEQDFVNRIIQNLSLEIVIVR